MIELTNKFNIRLKIGKETKHR